MLHQNNLRIPNIAPQLRFFQNIIPGLEKILAGVVVFTVGNYAIGNIAGQLIYNGSKDVYESSGKLYNMYCEDYPKSIICSGLHSNQCDNVDSLPC
ncbi:MAG: hypothetical protein WBJ81_01680 [Rickettsiales bacterium]